MNLLTQVKHFLAMGGYGFYVWSAYLLVIVTLVSVFTQAKLRNQRATKSIAQQNSLRGEE